MVTLIGSAKTRAFRVLWMLEELGLEYDIVDVMPHSEEITAVNPSGKVPALRIGDDVVIDSVAICQFLADRHGQFSYAAGSIERAQQDSWTQFATDDVESVLWTTAKHMFVLPEELRVPDAMKACRYDFDRAMKFMAQRLGERQYVMGDEFTVLDVILTHCANWAENGFNWDLPGDTVGEYFSRLRERPAYRRAIEKT